MEKEKFETAAETLISMLADYLIKGEPNEETVISNLRLFADQMEKLLPQQAEKALRYLIGEQLCENEQC